QRRATSTPPGLLIQTPPGRSTVRSKRSHPGAHSGTSVVGPAPSVTDPDHCTACGVFLSVPLAANAGPASRSETRIDCNVLIWFTSVNFIHFRIGQRAVRTKPDHWLCNWTMGSLLKACGPVHDKATAI